MLLTIGDLDAVRKQVQVEIPAALLPDGVILYPQFLPLAELRIREAIPKLSSLESNSTIEDAKNAGGYNEDYLLRLKTAIIKSTAAELIPSIRQRIQTQAGEYAERYAQIDWNAERLRLLAEVDCLLNELNGVEKKGVIANRSLIFFRIGKGG